MSKTKTRFFLFALMSLLIFGMVAIMMEGRAWQILAVSGSAVAFAASWSLLFLRKVPRYWYGSMVAVALPSWLALLVSLGDLFVSDSWGSWARLWLFVGVMASWGFVMALFMTLEKRWLRPSQ